MNKLLLLTFLTIALIFPVSAQGITAPVAPEAAEEYMPEHTESFSEGIYHIFITAMEKLQPKLLQAGRSCLAVIAVTLLVSLVQSFSATAKNITELVGAVGICLLLLQPANSLIRMGAETVEELSEYGKLLLAVMSAALASQGATNTAAAIYTATATFSTILSSLIVQIIVPLTYVFLCFCIARSAIGDDTLGRISSLVKSAAVWCLKSVLYIFTGYISISGVISGSVDATAIKAAKLTISGVVPVVGGILSDASETILVSASLVKNAAGIYGLLALLSIWVGPFLEIGVQYLLLNATSGICAIFSSKRTCELIKNFSAVMGLLLAMTGAVCLLLMVSTVCLMKGVSA